MASRRPQAGASHRLFVTVCPLDLWWMLPSVWVFALKHEERVQKAFLVDHHGPEDARLSHSAKPSLPRGMRLCDRLSEKRSERASKRPRGARGRYLPQEQEAC